MADIHISTKEYRELCEDSVKIAIIKDMADDNGYIDRDILKSILRCRKDGTHTRV